MRTTVIFDNCGPYHEARLRAAARLSELTAVQVSGKSAEYAWEHEARADGMRLLTLFPRTDAAPPSPLETARRIGKVLAESQPEAVAVPGWATPVALAALGWCCRNRVPAVIMSESTAWDEKRTAWKEAIKRRLVSLATAALVGGRAHAEYLMQLGLPPDRIVFGYDAVDNGYFREKAAELRAQGTGARIARGLPENYFLASSRFIEKKNLPRLLQAFARYLRLWTKGSKKIAAQKTSPPWLLVLLGDGVLHAALCTQIAELNLKEHVLLPGFQQYPDLPVYYAFAGAFVLPSSVEQWGLVVNEAMASGLPVLVSNRCGCAADLVENGRNGFTFDPLDVDALAELMHRMSLLPPECRKAMGAESETLVRKCDPECFAEGLKTTTDKAISQGPVRKGTWLDSLLWRSLLVR